MTRLDPNTHKGSGRRAAIGGAGSLCLLLALLAIGAPATASALGAQPEYKLCVKSAKVAKKYTGEYNDKTCTQVNAQGEGEYETKAIASYPYAFEGKSKASAIYYYGQHGEGIVWEVGCAKGEARGLITAPATGTETLTFEACKATDEQAAGAKPILCQATVKATIESVLVETRPGGEAGVLIYPGFAKPYKCGSVAFGAMAGFAAGKIGNAGKGPNGVFAVDRAIGAQENGEFYDFEEKEVFTGLFESPVSGSPTLDAGLETTVALGPTKGLVVKS